MMNSCSSSHNLSDLTGVMLENEKLTKKENKNKCFHCCSMKEEIIDRDIETTCLCFNIYTSFLEFECNKKHNCSSKINTYIIGCCTFYCI
jgi:hypothetical protein